MTFLTKTAVCCVALCAMVLPLRADDVVVPMDVQITLFAKIWKLDRTFEPGPVVNIAVLYQQEYRPSANAARQLIAAIHAAKLPIKCTLVDLDEQETVRGRIPSDGFDVFYVTPLRAIDIATIAEISRVNRIKTMTGVPEYVAAGLAVGIGLLQQRPVIIINLRASRAEGSEFMAQLLKLARVIEQGGAAYAGTTSQ